MYISLRSSLLDSESQTLCVFTYPLPVPQTPLMPAHWAYLDDDDDDRMTLADAMTIDARSTRSMKTLRPPENKKPGCYVQLKKLRPRDAFVSGILVKLCSLYLWWLHTCIRDWSLYIYIITGRLQNGRKGGGGGGDT